MRVSNLHLRNIRAFEKADLQLSRRINLLVGANNAGKTTLIKSLYKLQDNNILDLEDVRKGVSTGSIEIDISEIAPNELLSFTTKRNDPVPTQEKVRILFGLHPDERYDTANSRESLLVDMSLEGHLTKEEYGALPKATFHGFPRDEKKKNFIYPIFSRRKYYYGRQVHPMKGFEVSSDLTNIVSKVSHVSTSSHPLNRRFNQIISDILGFQVGVVPIRENESNVGIYTSPTEVVHMEQMGDGVFNIVAIVTLLLTENNNLYLIEEPETDIHPAALKKLMNLIIEKSANNQFVISTHSNIVLKYLASELTTKIFEINSDIDKFLETNIPTSSVTEVENNTAERLRLLENLGYDLFDIDMYKYYFVFEESSAERIIGEFLIPEFAPGLQNKVRTIAARGTSDVEARITDFERLFVYLHREPLYKNRAWVFVDGDTSGLETIQSLRSKFPTWENDHFINFSQPFFENYYPQRFSEEFESINSENNKKAKWEKKVAFTQKIIHWIHTNRNEAKELFMKSAKPVIDILKRFEQTLNL